MKNRRDSWERKKRKKRSRHVVLFSRSRTALLFFFLTMKEDSEDSIKAYRSNEQEEGTKGRT